MARSKWASHFKGRIPDKQKIAKCFKEDNEIEKQYICNIYMKQKKWQLAVDENYESHLNEVTFALQAS